MGYTTEFRGQISVSPPLNAEEIAYLKKLNDTRRMNRTQGPYFVDGDGYMGQGGPKDGDTIIDANCPPRGQPGLWCHWVPTEDGKAIYWDGGEKFYDSAEWMAYVIDHFLKPGAIAKSALPFLQANHVCNGEIEAQGEDSSDRWYLIVKNNAVATQDAVFHRVGKPRRIA